jgi:hypothetical protein
MKKQLLALMIISITLCTACKKENYAAKLRQDTHEQLQGKWYIESIVREVYEPISTLSSRTEYAGKPTDYYLFKANHNVDITLPQPGQSNEEGYEVVNPSQLIIGNEVWWIKDLTAESFQLLKDRNQVEETRRYVTRIYLAR